MASIKRESSLANGKRNVAQALQLDSSGNLEAAYVQYLQSIQHITGDLLFATTQPDYVCSRDADPKLVRLAQQCMDRVSDICDGFSVHPECKRVDIQNSIVLSPTPNQAPEPTVLRFVDSPRIKSSRTESVASDTSSISSMVGDFHARNKESTPMQIAVQRNQKLILAYRARMAKLGKHEASNLSLSLQRRLAENVALAKKREAALEKRLQERHKRLLDEAEERMQYTTGMSRNEQERRQMYANVREYEQDTKWMLPLKEKLADNPDNENAQQELIQRVIRAADHPLARYIGKHQYAIYDKVRPLLDKFRSRMVPERASDSGTPTAGDSSYDISNDTTIPLSPACGSHQDDEFDYLFESDEHTKANIPSANGGDTRIDSSGAQDSEIESSEIACKLMPDRPEQMICDSANTNMVPLDKLEQEALQRHTDNIARDIHEYLEKIQSMFVVVYEQLDTVTGRELIYGCLEESFYKPIWGYVLELYRLVHYEQELALKGALAEHKQSSPEVFKVSKRLWLDNTNDFKSDEMPNENDALPSSYPYAKAITEMQKISALDSPLFKLECAVRVSRLVCSSVEEWYADKEDPVPNIGADELVPVLCYVIARANLPLLVAECHAMEELMHEGYLMGEEGYCLASVQTALGYVISLAK